ncbi:hypothetical protein ACTHSI_19875, partial [Neisseria sp. P0001.S004]
MQAFFRLYPNFTSDLIGFQKSIYQTVSSWHRQKWRLLCYQISMNTQSSPNIIPFGIFLWRFAVILYNTPIIFCFIPKGTASCPNGQLQNLNPK